MLWVITTIAQHPLGRAPHLKNLAWALNGTPHRVFVNTFCNWPKSIQLENSNVADWLIEAPGGDPYRYYKFWDDLAHRLSPWPDEVRAFLFMQQDIFFTEPIDSLVSRCIEQEEIILQFSSPLQYAIFDASKVRQTKQGTVSARQPFIFPRIWEGATLLPAGLVGKALQEKISFGHLPSAFKKNSPLCQKNRSYFEAHALSDAQARPWTIRDYLERAYLRIKSDEPDGSFDTMLELTLYSWLKNEKFKVMASRTTTRGRAEISDYAVHFHYPEKMHRESKGKVYENLSMVWDCAKYMRPSIGEMVFHYHLSNSIPNSRVSERAECFRYLPGLINFRNKLSRLSWRAPEWMDAPMLSRLREAQRAVFAEVPIREVIFRVAGICAQPLK